LRPTRILATGGSLLGVATLALAMSAPTAAADPGPTGSAYALSVETTLLNQPLVSVDPLPTAAYPSGADESVVKIGPVAGLVSAKVLNASSNLDDGVLTSAASLAEVKVKDILEAKIVSAECTAGPDGLVGKSSLAELTVLGQKIDVSVTGTIDVAGVATVALNEQIESDGTLTVNAVHVHVGGPVGSITSADIVLSQAVCSGTGTTPTTTTEPTEPTEPTTTTEPTDTTTPPDTTTSQPGVDNKADEDNLAETGVSSILPISLAGLALLAAGGGALIFARRRRATVTDSSSDS
jgi:LPXTG-motif cell wall-anchored protein